MQLSCESNRFKGELCFSSLDLCDLLLWSSHALESANSDRRRRSTTGSFSTDAIVTPSIDSQRSKFCWYSSMVSPGNSNTGTGANGLPSSSSGGCSSFSCKNSSRANGRLDSTFLPTLFDRPRPPLRVRLLSAGSRDLPSELAMVSSGQFWCLRLLRRDREEIVSDTTIFFCYEANVHACLVSSIRATASV